MHPQVVLIVAKQRIADLRRAADHDRLVHTATTTSSHAVPPTGKPPPRQSRSCDGSAAVVRSLLDGRLEPRDGQARDCK